MLKITHRNVYKLRKNTIGLVSVAFALVGFCGIAGPTVMAEEVAKDTIEEMQTETYGKMDDVAEEIMEDATEKSSISEEMSGQGTSEELAAEEETPIKVIENHLELDPIKAGSNKISGNTHPGSFIFINVDNDVVTSVDNDLQADMTGRFEYELKSPLLYNQTVEVTSTPSELFTEDVETEEIKKTLVTERHPDAYPLPSQPLEKDENNRHQVLIEPVIEGVGKVTGHTSIRGAVYLMLKGSFVSQKTSIGENGAFTVQLDESLEGPKFKAGDVVALSFISEDGISLIAKETVRPFGKIEKPAVYHSEPLVSATPSLKGRTSSNGQILLFDAQNYEFVAEALADEEGNFDTALETLEPGATYYRVFYDRNNQVERVLLDTVNGGSVEVAQESIATLVARLQEVDMDEPTGETPILLPKLHNEKEYIVGRTIFPQTYVRLYSSNKEKQYPPIEVDELGFFGINIQDIDLPFEKGEVIRFEVIRPVDNKVLATQEVAVAGYLDDEEIDEYPFRIDAITSDHAYLAGKVAPNLYIKVYQTVDEKDLIAEGESGADGSFLMDLGDKQLTKGATLSFYAFNQEGEQVAWKVETVMKGKGERILAPKREMTDESVPDKKAEESLLPDENIAKEDMLVKSNMDDLKKEEGLVPNSTKQLIINELPKSSNNQVKPNSVSEKQPSSIQETKTITPQVSANMGNSSVKVGKQLPLTGTKSSVLSVLLGLGMMLLTIFSFLKKEQK